MATTLDRILARVPAAAADGKRPAVTLTYSQSLDGSIALSSGRPVRLSGPEAMRMTHRLRSSHDALLIGIGTLLADNPRLTVREVEGEHPQPVVLDTHLRSPNDAAIFDHPKPPLIASGPRPNSERAAELESAGGRVLPLPTNAEGLISLAWLLDRLGQLGIQTLMVEGGARVITSFLKAGLADTYVLTVAPTLVGGLHAVQAMDGSPNLTDVDWGLLGDDMVIWGEFA